MKLKERLTHMKVVRLRESEYLAIEAAAEKFDFTESQVIRRALRVGLPILQQVTAPGDRLVRSPETGQR